MLADAETFAFDELRFEQAASGLLSWLTRTDESQTVLGYRAELCGRRRERVEDGSGERVAAAGRQ
jgi:hypothetical protein